MDNLETKSAVLELLDKPLACVVEKVGKEEENWHEMLERLAQSPMKIKENANQERTRKRSMPKIDEIATHKMQRGGFTSEEHKASRRRLQYTS